ncbi:hypothetical protein OESDEN_24412, partial [Oesophagostomum dentatum]
MGKSTTSPCQNQEIIDLVENSVNPRLQQLKNKLISMGLRDYDIEWTVQNN